MVIGIMKVKNPNKRLLFLLALNWFMSNSSPAINIIYSKPMVENRSTAEFFSRIFSPCGPIMTPEIIKPIIPGIFNFRSRIGESKIISRIKEKINTGFPSGNSNSWIKCSKKSVIRFAYYCFNFCLNWQ